MTCWVTSCMSGPVLPSDCSAFLHSLWSRNALEVNKRKEPRTVSERGFCTKKEITNMHFFLILLQLYWYNVENSVCLFLNFVLIPWERVPPFQSQPHVFFLSRVWSCEEERVLCEHRIIPHNDDGVVVHFHQRASAMLLKLSQGYQCSTVFTSHFEITSLFSGQLWSCSFSFFLLAL